MNNRATLRQRYRTRRSAVALACHVATLLLMAWRSPLHLRVWVADTALMISRVSFALAILLVPIAAQQTASRHPLWGQVEQNARAIEDLEQEVRDLRDLKTEIAGLRSDLKPLLETPAKVESNGRAIARMQGEASGWGDAAGGATPPTLLLLWFLLRQWRNGHSGPETKQS